MLVLSRKLGEQVRIGDDIVITVVRGARVRIGIEAPEDVPVIRGELPDSGDEPENENA